MRGLLIGRFQPFHLGHQAVLRHLRTAQPNESIILGVGSAQASFTWENPLTAGERMEMISRALADETNARILPVPIVDVERHAVWVSHVASLVPPFTRVYTNNPLTRLLFEHAGYTVINPPLFDRDHFQGEVIRRNMLASEEWRKWVPASVVAYLAEIDAVKRIQMLKGASSHERA